MEIKAKKSDLLSTELKERIQYLGTALEQCNKIIATLKEENELLKKTQKLLKETKQ
ncbi:MAG TPA: hypothetical protein VMX17_10875 [Candidatus Glassbacteria bacterium]|jgi:hypothetical protein|nr:hypothetical protein [Candidatus Glassbacteria bacterium]